MEKKIIGYGELKKYISDNDASSFMSKNIFHLNKKTNRCFHGTTFYLYRNLSSDAVKNLKEEFGNIITGTCYYKERPEEVFQTITIFKDYVDNVVQGENYHFI